jgi:hypothetical protein
MLVRLCQNINFGSICGLQIRKGQPVFDRPPVVLIDFKLDGGDPPRTETSLTDFELAQEVVRLLERLDELVTTSVEVLEVRAGIPRRAVFKAVGLQASAGATP